MFIAKFKDGTKISLVDDWHLDELKELRKKRSFFCPVCEASVQLKLGTTRLWHFAHEPHAACSDLGENESLYHLKGKKFLYQWLQSHQVKVALECYLPIIRQRPDLLFRFNDTLYAIEYQCSPIETTLLEKRTQGYNQIGIIPIWILGGNRLKRFGPHTFSLKSYEWLCTHTSKSHFFHLTYFCPEQTRFAQLHQITPYSSTKFLASYHESPLFKTPLHSIVQPNFEGKGNMFDKWMTVRKNWRYKNLSPYPAKIERIIRELLYKNGIPPSLFPIETGWPTAYHYLISSSPYHWQLLILFECLQHQPLNQPFSRKIVIQCLFPYIENRWLMLRRISEPWTQAIDGFLHFLTRIGYLGKVESKQGMFKRLRNPVIPTNVEEAVVLDQSLKLRS
ncbi:competence protein CoiA [Halalkalibacter alkalisediminis]|uniref:Competence protein CoiA n=1 Tax=Halalkalibacter alkalisediminis TaxID=935616 RepID=A0ABV6NBS9_9BACI|nr:competence protein CoiA family protein [Halalkalibacter alkalisediminis]